MRLIPILLMTGLCSCGGSTEKKMPSAGSGAMNDSVVVYNQHIVGTESQEIDDYILRHHWDMTRTETGLRIMIYKTGSGPKVRPGDSVTIDFTISLLTGDPVFKSDSTVHLTFQPGKRDVVSGLEEGIMLMRKGDRAKLIVPSHLAFGLLGDLKNIHGRAALVYDVALSGIDPVKK